MIDISLIFRIDYFFFCTINKLKKKKCFFFFLTGNNGKLNLFNYYTEKKKCFISKVDLRPKTKNFKKPILFKRIKIYIYIHRGRAHETMSRGKIKVLN